MALRDAVYGAAVGDTLGVPYEFKPRGTFACSGMAGFGTHFQPAGTWSDDTSLMLATCASIKAKGGRVDAADIRLNFEDWYYDGAFAIDSIVFDVGGTTSARSRPSRMRTRSRPGRACGSSTSCAIPALLSR